MAQYDGSIRINTEINTSQFMNLENRIAKTADKIASLRSKMDALKDAKIPTQEYKEISAQIQKAELEFNKLLEKQEQMQREGKDNGVAWERLNEKMEETGNTIRYAQGELQDLVDTGKAFTLGSGTEEYANLAQKLQYTENDMAVLNKRHDELIAKQGKTSNGYKKLGETAKKSFEKINKTSNKSGSFLGTLATRFKGLALSLLIFNQISKAFNAMISGIKKGFDNFYATNNGFKKSIDGLKTSMSTLQNSFAAAFAPLVQMAVPYIQKAVEWITSLINVIGRFIAAISGQKSYTKAIKQTTAAINGQTKAQNKQLSSLDKLNNLSSDSGGGGGTGSGEMFEEVPVDAKVPDIFEKIAEYAKQLKDIFKQGFWDGLGDWECRLESIKGSISSIKDSLVDIWTEPAVLAAADGWVQSIAYMLGSLVGSLASIGLTIATNLVGGIAKYLEQNKDRIKGYLISMFDIWDEINMMFAELFQSISYVFEAFASEQGQQLTANIIGIFSDAFMGITEMASKLFRDIANIIIQPFVENKEAFRAALEGFLGVLAEVTGTIKIGIDETFDKLNEVYDEKLKPFFDSIASGLSDTAGKFMEFWNGNVQPILDEWAAKFDEVWNVHIQPMLNNFIGLFGDVADLLKFVWESILKPLIDWVIAYVAPILLNTVDIVVNKFFAALGMIADIIDGVKSIFRGLIQFLTGVFTGDWEKAWDGVVKIFDGVKDTIKGVVNGILGVVESMANGVVNAMNIVIRAFNGLNFDIPGWVPLIGGNSYGFNIPEIQNISIPRLATGTVVPPNREFMAVLGDNKKEPEIVSPLSTIEQAVENALKRSGGTGGLKEITIRVPVEIDGKSLFEIMQKIDVEEFNRTGNPSFQF